MYPRASERPIPRVRCKVFWDATSTLIMVEASFRALALLGEELPVLMGNENPGAGIPSLRGIDQFLGALVPGQVAGAEYRGKGQMLRISVDEFRIRMRQ